MLSSVSVPQDHTLQMKQVALSLPSLIYLQQWKPWPQQPFCWMDQRRPELMSHTEQHIWTVYTLAGAWICMNGSQWFWICSLVYLGGIWSSTFNHTQKVSLGSVPSHLMEDLSRVETRLCALLSCAEVQKGSYHQEEEAAEGQRWQRHLHR